MSNESDQSVHRPPTSSDEIGTAGVAERNPAFGIHLPALLARIETASRALENSFARIRELEQLVEGLNDQHMETIARLHEADRRSAELEQSLAIERMHSARAEKLAEEAGNRATQMEEAAFQAVEKFDALTSTIDAAFAEMPSDMCAIQKAA